MKNKIIIASVALVLIAATVAIAFAVTTSEDKLVVDLTLGSKTYVKINKDKDFKIADVDFVPAGGKIPSGVSEIDIYKFSVDLAGQPSCSLKVLSVTIDDGKVDLSPVIAVEVYEGERKLDEGEKLKENTDYVVKARWTVDRESDKVTPELVNKKITVKLEISTSEQ